MHAQLEIPRQYLLAGTGPAAEQQCCSIQKFFIRLCYDPFLHIESGQVWSAEQRRISKNSDQEPKTRNILLICFLVAFFFTLGGRSLIQILVEVAYSASTAH